MEMMMGIFRRLTGLFSSGPAVQDSAPNKSLDESRRMDDRPTEKMDAKFIEAVGLFDELDKMVNKYGMTVWNLYGDHFPELENIVSDNVMYAKVVKLMGNRTNAATLDFSEILPEEVETQLKEAAAISIGCELNELDLININGLCDQVLSLSESRDQLYGDLKTKMNTIAPNLTALVGDLVGARLIAHAGGSLNLAKQPGRTIQIYSAEKAFHRARKTKHATPKYRRIIYNSPLISKAAPRFKGKMARTLSAKIALAIRYDVLGDAQDNTMGLQTLTKLEARLRSLEGRAMPRPIETYNRSADEVAPMLFESKIKKKRTKRSLVEKQEKPFETEDDSQGQNDIRQIHKSNDEDDAQGQNDTRQMPKSNDEDEIFAT
ncbi:probable nucleolar protein 5-2 [Papaver somniferum]|uniref:probable nucleolar protein 5-2 n=1 Tax=Papaver somniferum TaxID=3469 RepID=UPI000E7034C0|nr:probable nucleolar protein 5-2 [Papaver somniferum]